MQPPDAANAGIGRSPAAPAATAGNGPPERLLILGASARAAAWSARRAGYAPLAVDLFADVDLRRIATSRRAGAYPQGLATAAEQLPPAPWIYTGGLENHPELVERLAGIRPLLGNPAQVLRAVRDPWLLDDAVRPVGWRLPESHPESASVGPGEWLSKPLRSAAGLGIRVWSAEDRSRRSSRQSTATPERYLQRWIPGPVHSAAFLGTPQGARLLSVQRQLAGCGWLNARPFVYSGNVGPLPVDNPTRQALQTLGKRLVERFGLRGLFGVDFLFDPVHPQDPRHSHDTRNLEAPRHFILEVNPRFTAAMELAERAGWPSLVGLHVEACRQGPAPASGPCGLGVEPAEAAEGGIFGEWDKPPAGEPVRPQGKAVLYASRGLIVDSRLLALWQSAASSGPGWLADVPAPGQRIRPGHPLVTVFASGRDEQDVIRGLRRRVAWLKKTLGLT